MIRIIPEERSHVFGRGIATLYESQFRVGWNFSKKSPKLAAIRVRKMVAQEDYIKLFRAEQPLSLPATPGSGYVVSFIRQQNLQARE